MGRIRSLWLFLGLVLFAVSFYDVTADVIPSENECRPYIEKAIHELKNTESTATENDSIEDNKTGEEDASIETTTTSEPIEDANADDDKSQEEQQADADDSKENDEQPSAEDGSEKDSDDNQSSEVAEDEKVDADNDSKEAGDDEANQTAEDDGDSKEEAADDKDSKEDAAEADDKDSKEAEADDKDSKEAEADDKDSKEAEADDKDSKEEAADDKESKEEGAAADDNDSKEEATDDDGVDSKEEATDKDDDNSKEEAATDDDGKDSKEDTAEDDNNTAEEAATDDDSKENEAEAADDSKENDGEEAQGAESLEEGNTAAEDDGDSQESENEEKAADADDDTKEDQTEEANDTQEQPDETDDNEDSAEEEKVRAKRSISDEATPEDNDTAEDDKTAEETDNSQEEKDDTKEEDSQEEKANDDESQEAANDEDDDDDDTPSEEDIVEEELTLGFEIPKNLRQRDHISELLGLDAISSIKENALKRTGDVILKELKRIYDNAIKPLETLYKYRDLSNRHFGDPEIFSKPLIVFMGPYSGGKSTILNYLTDNEYTPNSIRSGAEPSPAYFNILMHGDEPEVLDGTQLAADWTFAGLQKFGQGLNDRLRGQKLPSKLLERVNIVEIPGILEVRKQVSRYFPFNDACQWFIDRADIIFLVYDPSKLDVGPETEAILDQLKGREYQTRILLNKGDQVKPEELLRVQSALIWNISPLMSSAQPPVMYTVSLWSHPFEQGAPVRLLQAQERAMLADLREAIDKRIENKIASARRFAVRIRNHAKMVDCYLTTYYNQKSLFSNKKQVSDKIIEHPQNYNIYEGLSTLTNISRYDLPDPEVYLDFFRLNPLYEFRKLSDTCTYFKGCPINKLDIAIAYDLPELVGKYKKLLEENYAQLRKEFDENCNDSNIDPPVKLNSR